MTLEIKDLVESVPAVLNERVRVVSESTSNKSGVFILYWMRTAMRADENPALDLAIETANRLQLPLLK